LRLFSFGGYGLALAALALVVLALSNAPRCMLVFRAGFCLRILGCYGLKLEQSQKRHSTREAKALNKGYSIFPLKEPVKMSENPASAFRDGMERAGCF